MDSRAKELIQIGSGLFSKKKQWDQLCQDIAENFYPMRADFTSAFTLGDDFSENLMESFPVQARETLANTIAALLRQGEWFEVKTGIEDIDEDSENADWLEYATKTFRRMIYDKRANFVRAMGEADHDWVSFGNPVLSVEESPDRSHPLFRSWHPKQCAWMENEVGKVDHLQRNMPMTARNMKMKAAWKGKLHSDIENAATKEPTKEFKVRHIVLPVEEIYGDDQAKRRKYGDNTHVSMYIDVDNQIVLSESPLPMFNYVVPRCRTISGFQYGFSPFAINALPDGRMIQSLARILLEEGEKAIDPPTIAKGEIFRDAVNLYAGGMTYVDLEADEKLQDVFQTLHSGGSVNIGLEIKQDVRNMIAESFLLNKITLPPQQKTAFETQARLEEYRRAIVPFTGPIESEYHHPVLDVAFSMGVRNGMFDRKTMPKALSEADITFTFEGPLNTAEGRQMVQAFQESVQILAGAANFEPKVATLMDFKQMTKDAVRGTQAPADWFLDEDVQQTAEEEAASKAGLQEAAAMLKEGAGVAGEVAGASQQLSEAGLA